MGSWQAELWQSRGGQRIPLARSQFFLELQYKKTVLFEDFLVCCRVLCAKILWDVSCKVLELFRDLFYWYSWSVGGRFSPSSLPCFLKPSHVCASLYLAFFLFFMQCLHQHCTWYPAPRNKLCLCAEPVKLTCRTSWVKVFPQTFTTEISEMCVSRSEGRLQHSLDLQAVLNLDDWSPFWMVESAQHPDSCNVFHDWGRCIYETLQPSKSPRLSQCVCFTGVATIPWPFGNMAMISQGIQGHS